MDDKKELNEEELEQVTGGISAVYANRNGSKAAIQSNKANCPEANGSKAVENKSRRYMNGPA